MVITPPTADKTSLIKTGIGFAVAVIILVLVYIYGIKPELYTTASKSFESGNSFVQIGKTGKIALQPVNDVDQAINAVSTGILTYNKQYFQPIADMKNYQTKAAMASYQPAGVYQDAAQVASTYQPKGDYLDISKTVYIQNAAKGSNYFGAYGDRGGFYANNTKGQSYNHWTLSQ
tara:strand:- start:910 stop:1434 length:525 start_codon:yes stop_codon:yes gene_type:complete